MAAASIHARGEVLNVTSDYGAPTASYRKLQGRYRKIFADDVQEYVERWYNDFATPTQRHNFKRIVKEVFEIRRLRGEVPAPTAQQLLEARAVLEKNGDRLIAPMHRDKMLAWLVNAGKADRQVFRETFGCIEPLKLFNGKSDYNRTFTVEAVDNTAEKIFRRSEEAAKRKLQAEKLALLRGYPPRVDVATGSQDGSSTVLSSDATLLSTEDGVEARNNVPLRIQRKGLRATTYDASFGGRTEHQQLRPSGTKAWMSTYGGAPWGYVQEGFVSGVLQSHTTQCYPSWVNDDQHRNYNENYAVLLAKRSRRQHRDRLREHLLSTPEGQAAFRARSARRASRPPRGPESPWQAQPPRAPELSELAATSPRREAIRAQFITPPPGRDHRRLIRPLTAQPRGATIHSIAFGIKVEPKEA